MTSVYADAIEKTCQDHGGLSLKVLCIMFFQVGTNNLNLSKAMQWLGVTYTRRFNNRYARSGHLFQGRFKSLIVENDAYLVRLSCYIHRNPLRAGIVKRLIDHKWSSYPVYAYNRKYPEWLKTDTILSQFGTDNPQLSYRKKVQRYSKEEASLFEELRYGLFFGTVGFADRLKSGFLPDFKKKSTSRTASTDNAA